MIAQKWILMGLLLTGIITMFDEFGIMGGNTYNPNYAIDEASVNGITQLDDSQAVAEDSWWERNIPGAGAYAWLSKAVSFVGELFSKLYHMGSIVSEYVPGNVGIAFMYLINGVMLYIVAWSGLQIWLKISTKYMD